MSARDFLVENLTHEFSFTFGVKDPAYIQELADAWMDDQENSRHRFEALSRLLLRPHRILDMAAGCGTCVFYGLLNGYDMYGIDPEEWKFAFNRMKAEERGYDPSWKERFLMGVGERLPFPDNDFDCVTSYQTLEHVRDPRLVLQEMVRVTRPGGGIHLRCPDYRSTFEGHYRLPWLPLFPRPLAKGYLRALGRPSRGLDTIQYTTLPRVRRWLRQIREETGARLAVVDVQASWHKSPGAYARYQAREFLRRLFRQEMEVDLLIHVLKKPGG